MIRLKCTQTLQDKLRIIENRLMRIHTGHGGQPETFERDCFILLKSAYNAQRQPVIEAVIRAMQEFESIRSSREEQSVELRYESKLKRCIIYS